MTGTRDETGANDETDAIGDSGTISMGRDCRIDDGVRIAHESDGEVTRIGDGARIRSGTVIYPGVRIGANFATGHDALIREDTRIGDDVLVGTKAVIDGATTVGDRTSLQTGVYVPTETSIGDDVFLGPRAVLTNDPYPVRTEVELSGPDLRDGVTVGANATLLPDVTVGRGAFVAAGAVVTEDVPEETLAIGSPAQHRELPPEIGEANDLS
jgi:acetyltransferase-like isoleucine patch superfamily enzyme